MVVVVVVIEQGNAKVESCVSADRRLLIVSRVDQVTFCNVQNYTHPFNGLFSRTTWVSRYQKGKTTLDLNETRDDGAVGCSGIRWTICKQSVPHSRQITTPIPHHSIFTGRMLFLMPNQQCQSTEGKSK